MDMAIRRQAMAAGIVLPEWDVDWEGDEGITPETAGFTRTLSSSGTRSTSLLTKSVQITVKGSSSWVRYDWSSDETIGVLETDIAIWGPQCYFLVRFGDGINSVGVRAQYSTNYKGLYLMDHSSAADNTKLLTMEEDTRYVVRIVKRATDCDVYIDGVLKASEVALSTLPYSTDYKGVACQATGTTQATGNVYAMRLKLGRVS